MRLRMWWIFFLQFNSLIIADLSFRSLYSCLMCLPSPCPAVDKLWDKVRRYSRTAVVGLSGLMMMIDMNNDVSSLIRSGWRAKNGRASIEIYSKLSDLAVWMEACRWWLVRSGDRQPQEDRHYTYVCGEERYSARWWINSIYIIPKTLSNNTVT